jgi:hypothetical protein
MTEMNDCEIGPSINSQTVNSSKEEQVKKLVLMLVVLLVLASASAWSQDKYPKAEVFGGFSVLSLDTGWERIQPFGFQASVAGNFHKNMGIVGDFGGQYKNGGGVYEYLFGPQFSMRQSKTTVFAHALFGGINAGGQISDSAFAMGFGGGLDLNASDHFAVRAVQFDWIPIHGSGAWDANTIRFGFGIVIK